MSSRPAIKSAAIPRAGYDYQDLAGIEVLIRHYRDPNLFEWVILESDDPKIRALDDIVALRRDGGVEYTQVKFTVDPQNYELDWSWLLEKKPRGTSMLAKWATSYHRARAFGPIKSASLKTNRVPSAAFRTCLRNSRVCLRQLSKDIRERVISECGGQTNARLFFSDFSFVGGMLDLAQLESTLRDELVPSDTDSSGWLLLRDHVRRWATFKNVPPPDGRIRREHLLQLITSRRPQPIRQDFHIPLGYSPPSRPFDDALRSRVASKGAPITILWGSPGRGKSTYLSYLAHELEDETGVVLRHHYFLSMNESSVDRVSIIDIANSLLHQLVAKDPDAARGFSGEPHRLRDDLAGVATNLAARGKKLFLIVDGLDHVWRDSRRTDQLEHLFNLLLPLSDNITLLVGTQRVPDAQLPAKLLIAAAAPDWIELPAMDRSAVCAWVKSQDQVRPMLVDPPAHRSRADEVDEIAEALFSISHGHPLHLIYVLESLIRRDTPIDADAVRAVPPCPDGDIRTYYASLWLRLSSAAQEILHALAGSPFYWPMRGIRRTFGDPGEIEFLLEPRHSGMMPFHGSIFAWVRERTDHADIVRALFERIIEWLESGAPEYWRWGWLWIMKARSGQPDELLRSATRDWAVDSMANGWPENQIEEILGEAKRHAFAKSDLPTTVRLNSIETRVANAREFQSPNYGFFRATALEISSNVQQALNLVDRLGELDDQEVVLLAKAGPLEAREELIRACLEELWRRVNTWILLRHKPSSDFVDLADALIDCAALAGIAVVPRMVNFLRGFRNPAPRLSRYITAIGEVGDLATLRELGSYLRGKKYEHQRRLLEDQLVRAALRQGVDLKFVLGRRARLLSPLAVAHRILRQPETSVAIPLPAIEPDLVRERYMSDPADDVFRTFCDAFWVAFCRALLPTAGPQPSYPGLDRDAAGWLTEALDVLQNAAGDLAGGRERLVFSAIYEAAGSLAPVAFSASNDRRFSEYRAFKRSLQVIAVDLHLLGSEGAADKQIAASELSIVRHSLHWSDEAWVGDCVADRKALLSTEAAEELLTESVAELASQVTEFNERAGKWTQLASFARLQGVGDPHALLRRASDCLLGYGYRKDLGAMDVLDAIERVSQHDPSRTEAWIRAVTPVVDAITEFTDGDETDQVRSDLITTVANAMPIALPLFYAHHIRRDEWRYADECLRALLRRLPMNPPESCALGATLLDATSLATLGDRAAQDGATRGILDRQLLYLGGAPQSPRDRLYSRDDRSAKTRKVGVSRFPPAKLEALLERLASPDVLYGTRKKILSDWLSYWSGKGKAIQVLNALDAYLESHDSGIAVEDVLDQAFGLSLDCQGRDAAYRWLVRAQVYRRGWASFWVEEKEVMARLHKAAELYPERWLQFIKDSSVPPPWWRRQGWDFTIGQKYLVRFLLLAGEVAAAASVTAELVDNLVAEVRDQPLGRVEWLG